jgi:hypothetical protein
MCRRIRHGDHSVWTASRHLVEKISEASALPPSIARDTDRITAKLSLDAEPLFFRV